MVEVGERQLLRVEDVAVALGVSKRTVYDYLQSGIVRGRKVGRRWYVLGSDLLALVKATEAPAKPTRVIVRAQKAQRMPKGDLKPRVIGQ